MSAMARLNPARQRLLQKRGDDLVQAESVLASQIKTQVPEATRSECLKVAARIIRKRGS